MDNSYKLFVVTTYRLNGYCSVATSVVEYSSRCMAEEAFLKLRDVTIEAGSVKVTKLY